MVWKPVLENSEEMGVAINNSLILSFICDAVINVALANQKYEIKPKNCLFWFFFPLMRLLLKSCVQLWYTSFRKKGETLKRAKKWKHRNISKDGKKSMQCHSWESLSTVAFLAKGFISNLITLIGLSDMEKMFCREKLFSLSDKYITKAGIQN